MNPVRDTADAVRHAFHARGMEPAAIAVETTMYRGLSVLRIVLLAYAIYWNTGPRWHLYHEHQGLSVAALLLLAAWTAATVWGYASARRRTNALLAADLGITVAMMLATPYLQGTDHVSATFPTFWVFGVVIAWAIRFHVLGGLLAACLVTGVDLLIKADPDGAPLHATTVQNVMLLWIGGGVVGSLTSLLQRMAVERDLAERKAAAIEERARLARAIHDGTLQTLALVHRRCRDVGGEFAELVELGRIAGNQEASLRALLQDDSPPRLESSQEDREADLGARLAGLSSPNVSVAGPGRPVLLPHAVVVEVAAAVAECLSNVERHVGADAPAWILLEDLDRSVVVSVRDQGPGLDADRLQQARKEGRLGVQLSICGRMTALGGTARVTSTPHHGVEWELTVPRS